MSPKLRSAHMDPDVLIAESYATVALGNPNVTRAMKALRGHSFEKRPLMQGTDYRFDNKFIDPAEPGLRDRIFKLYNKELELSNKN